MKSFEENVKQLNTIKKELKTKEYPMAIIDLEFLVNQLKRELIEEDHKIKVCIKCGKEAKYKCMPVGYYKAKYYCEEHRPISVESCQKIE